MKLTVNQVMQKAINEQTEGNLEEAERLYQDILKAEPKNPDANHNLGALNVSLKKIDIGLSFLKTALDLDSNREQFWFSYIAILIDSGRFEEAQKNLKIAKEKGFKNEKFVTLEAYTYFHSGNSLKGMGRLEEAEASYRQAIFIKSDYIEAHNNLGNTLKKIGKTEEALASFRQAIAINPELSEAHNNLGTVLQEIGKTEEALASYRQAISLKNNYAEAHSNLGLSLKDIGRLDEAEESYRQAISINPHYDEANSNLGILYHDCGHFKKASEYLRLVDSYIGNIYLLKCLYMLDQESNFYNQLDHVMKQSENNATIGSMISSSNIRYGAGRYNPFCNEPLKYVLQTSLLEQYDFKSIFVDSVSEILGDQEIQTRSQALLTKGTQTAGNIFTRIGPVTGAIQSIIHLELEKYRVRFKYSNEGLITSWPTDYSIFGWLVSMKSGGELASHMHDRGWISGSIYINVPSKLNNDCGNLVLETSNIEDVIDGSDNKKSIDVVTGNLCLFPSSLHHYTIPFESKEDRIVLAFDVVPNS